MSTQKGNHAVWFTAIRRKRWALTLVAIAVIVGGVSAFTENVSKLTVRLYNSYIGVRDWYGTREVSDILYQADILFFNENKEKEATILYERAAKLGDPYAIATMAKIHHFGWGGNAADASRAASLALKALPALENSINSQPRYAYALALLYSEGIGVAKDAEKARNLYRLSSDAGFAPAQNNLAWMMRLGQGGLEDEAVGFNLTLNAAQQGHLNAIVWIGQAYRNGWFVKSSPIEAEKWHLKAIKFNSASAALELGLLYADEKTVKYNPLQAFNYFEMSHELGNSEATFHLALAYFSGRGVGEDNDKAINLWRQSAKAGNSRSALLVWSLNGIDGFEVGDVEALDFLNLAADDNLPQALKELSKVYRFGRLGAEVNHIKSFRLAQACLDAGLMDCHFEVAWHYAGGLGVEQNIDLAMYHYRIAMENGNAFAANNLASLIKEKHGADDSKANRERLRILQHAVELDENNSYFWWALGDLYSGEYAGIQKDTKEAHRKFLKGAELGDADSQNNVGWYYYEGKDGAIDIPLAINWLEKSAKQGSVEAVTNLFHILENENGTGLTKRKIETWRDEGLEYFEKSNAYDYCLLNYLATRFERGEEVKVNLEKAAALYEKSAHLGSVPASVNLARMVLNEQSFVISVEEALDLLQNAADKKLPGANLLMSKIYLEGKHKEQDKRKALRYFTSAVSFGLNIEKEVVENDFPENWIQLYIQEPMSCDGSLLAAVTLKKEQ